MFDTLLVLLIYILPVVLGLHIYYAVKRAQRPNNKGVLPVQSTGFTYDYELGQILVSTTQAYGIQASLPVELPEILVDSHTNDRAGRSINFAADNTQRLELEGNFYKDFAVYAPKGFEQETLQFLPPNVMQLLVTEARSFDMETFGRTLNLYSQKDPRQDQEIADELVTVATGIVAASENFFRSFRQPEDKTALFLTGRGVQMYKLGRRQLNAHAMAILSEIVIIILAVLLRIS